VTFHVDDIVTFTNTAMNIADRIDGEDGRVTSVARQGALWVSVLGSEVFVRDHADITLSDCPHQGEDQ
jgi:hypothetical protein